MVVPRFVKQALLGHPITVYGDGEQRRCWTYIDDALDGLVGLATSGAAVGEIFNLGSHFETSIKDLAFKVTVFELVFEDVLRDFPRWVSRNAIDNF